MSYDLNTYHQEQLNIENEPVIWPEIYTKQIRDYLVKKGSPKILFSSSRKWNTFFKSALQKKASSWGNYILYIVLR